MLYITDWLSYHLKNKLFVIIFTSHSSSVQENTTDPQHNNETTTPTGDPTCHDGGNISSSAKFQKFPQENFVTQNNHENDIICISHTGNVLHICPMFV